MWGKKKKPNMPIMVICHIRQELLLSRKQPRALVGGAGSGPSYPPPAEGSSPPRGAATPWRLPPPFSPAPHVHPKHCPAAISTLFLYIPCQRATQSTKVLPMECEPSSGASDIYRLVC